MIRFEEKHILMSRSLWKRFIWEEDGERRGTFAGEENIIGFLEYHSKYLVKSIRIVKRR